MIRLDSSFRFATFRMTRQHVILRKERPKNLNIANFEIPIYVFKQKLKKCQLHHIYLMSVMAKEIQTISFLLKRKTANHTIAIQYVVLYSKLHTIYCIKLLSCQDDEWPVTTSFIATIFRF